MLSLQTETLVGVGGLKFSKPSKSACVPLTVTSYPKALRNHVFRFLGPLMLGMARGPCGNLRVCVVKLVEPQGLSSNHIPFSHMYVCMYACM